jgi:hypothetical protein
MCGKTGLFTWTQEISSVMLIHDIPTDTNKKMVKCLFSKQSLEVRVNDVVLCNSTLSNPYVPDESYWQIETEGQKKQLIIVLQKTAGYWWPCVFKGDPEIDITKIDPPTAKLSDLSSDVRNDVEKMMLKNNGEKNRVEEEQRRKFGKQYPQFDFSEAKFN